jgi:hypothetical protein
VSVWDTSRVQIKLGEYGTLPALALSDPTHLSRTQEYRRAMASRMVPLAREDIRKRVPAGEYHVSRKIDGEFTVLIMEGGEVFSVNPGGTVRVGLPFASEAKALLTQAGLSRALIAGELYVDRPDGRRARVHDVTRILTAPASAEEIATLRFAAFDLIEPASSTHGDAWKKLTEIFGSGTNVRPVDAKLARSVDEVINLFDRWVVAEGGEGVVIRNDAAGVFKAKPRHTLDVVVLGFSEGLDDRRGMLHDLLVGLMRTDGSFHVLGRVGGGFTDDDRRGMLADLQDMAVASEYTEVNSASVAYKMVRPEWVIEISCLDMVSSTTRGAPIERMVLNWNREGSRWQVLRRLPLVSLISPVYLRKRSDKSVTPDDLRLRQVTDVVDVPMADRTAGDTLAKSEILRREVYTKVMKGQQMVRKLVMWKTNKDAVSNAHPAFVLHLTDYSPNRKNPLERELRVSNSREQIEAFWDEFAKGYFGKGWTKA